MHRPISNLIIHLVTWICLSIFLPLLPIGLGILIAALQNVQVSPFNLLNGIELCLISLGLVTATGIDLSRVRIQRSARPLISFVIRLILILLGISSIILLTLVYVDVYVIDMDFDRNTKFAFVGLLALTVALVTVVLQLYIGYTRYRMSAEEANS